MLFVQLKRHVLLAMRLLRAFYITILTLSALALVFHYLFVAVNEFTPDIGILALYHKALQHHLEVSSEGIELCFWNTAVGTAIRDGA